MDEQLKSRRLKSSGSKMKGSNTSPDLSPILFYDPEWNKNSMGLVYPTVLESFNKDTISELKQQRKKISTTPKKNCKNAEINKSEKSTLSTETTIKSKSKNAILSEFTDSSTISNNLKLDNRPISTGTLKKSSDKTVSTEPKATKDKIQTTLSSKTKQKTKSEYENKTIKTTLASKKNGEFIRLPKRGLNDKTVKQNDPEVAKDKTNKILSSKAKQEATLDHEASTIRTKLTSKKNEELPKRKLRSSRTYTEFKRELESVTDFSIENMDWYFKDEDYYKNKLDTILSDFSIPSSYHRNLFYSYLLLDSRKCRNKQHLSWRDFIDSIFYIGKGINKRVFQHAKEAEKTSEKKKCLKINEIWDSGNPIKEFIVTENIVSEEAATREAAMIDAMGLSRLCNIRRGTYYGVAETLKARERLELGATLLMQARDIFKWKEAIDEYRKTEPVIVSFLGRSLDQFTEESDGDELYDPDDLLTLRY